MKLEMKSMPIYFKEILLRLSNMFWGNLPWKGLFWMGQSVSSVTQWCLTPCNCMDWSTLGFPVHHQLPKATQLMSLSQWCHPAISSSVVSLSSRLQYSLASGCFPISWFYSSGAKLQGIFCIVYILNSILDVVSTVWEMSYILDMMS